MAVFIDLKKAFDTINHNILLRKLECIGVKGDLLLWISNYLHDRSQKLLRMVNYPRACPLHVGFHNDQY